MIFLRISMAEAVTYHGGKENSYVNQTHLRFGISFGHFYVKKIAICL